MQLALRIEHPSAADYLRCCLDVQADTAAVRYQLELRSSPHERHVPAVLMPIWDEHLRQVASTEDWAVEALPSSSYTLVALPWRHDYWFKASGDGSFQLQMKLPRTGFVELALRDLAAAKNLDDLFTALDHLKVEQRRAGFSCWEADATTAASASPVGSDRSDESVPSPAPALP